MPGTSELNYNQSAAIPYIKNDDVFQIVLVTNSSRSAWIYPKGLIEDGMTAENSAAKEALEEAGVVGKIECIVLDEYVYEKWDGTCNVKVYPLEVTELLDEWDEKSSRERLLIDIDEAIKKVKPVQQKGLTKLQDYLS